MKTSRIFSAVMLAVCGMALCACTESIPDDNGGGKPVPTVLTASIAQTTRTEIVPGEIPHPIHWAKGDIIVVHFDTDTDPNAMHWFGLKTGAGTTEGTFEWQDYGDTLPATYNSMIAGYAGGFVSFDDNAELVLEAHREIFLGLENVIDFPMHATADAGEPLAFLCGFGMVHLSVTGNVAINRIAINTFEQDGQEMSGKFHVDVETYETTFVEPGFASTNPYEIVWDDNAVTLTDTPIDFYGVMPDGTYHAGTTFTFTLTDGSTIVKTAQQPFTISRAQILNLPTLDVRQ